MFRWLPSFVIIVALAVFVVGCNTTSPSGTVSSVVVTGSVPTVGTSSQFTATATMSDGTTQDVTSSATWSSSNTADATVSTTGVVTGMIDGSDNISATYQNITGVETIVITG
jgi:hypothetical protein